MCSASLLGEVDVVEDVILTEAVVPGAFAAIPELHIGIVGVGTAAHGALMGVELVALLLTYALRLAAEVYGVGAGLMELYRLQQVAAAEDRAALNGQEALLPQSPGS